MKDNKILILAVLAIAGVVAVSGCTTNQTGNNTSNLGSNTVNIQNNAFTPSTLTVPVGTTVTWVNSDSTAHDVVSDSGAFNSGNLNNGQSFSFTFNQEGNYPYHCGIHPNMQGTIIVTGTSTTTTTSNNNNTSSSSYSDSNNSGSSNSYNNGNTNSNGYNY